MDNNKAKVSIVVPVYNSAEFIEQTIESVLNQTYANWELIIIDDGSEDNSLEIINKYKDCTKVILLNHPKNENQGVSKSRELGVENAKGEFIAFLDADDLFYKDKLKEQLEIFSKHKEVILVHSKVELLKEVELNFTNEFVLADCDKLYILNEQSDWLASNKICNSTVVVRAETLRELKFGLPQLFQFEDWLLWSLLAEKGYFYYENKKQIKYRIHSSSATGTILKNKLVAPYSKIEYLVSLYSLSEHNEYNDQIVRHLKGAIIDLLNVYSNGNLSKTDLFRVEINNSDLSNNSYAKKYNYLLREHIELQKEVKAILTVKNSLIYRVFNKIKKVF